MRFHRDAIPTLAALTAFLLAAPGAAQQRPTLSEAESRIGVLEAEVQDLEAEKIRTRDAVCAAADVNGQSYRPFVCEPRCDCLYPGDVAYTSCAETSTGLYAIGFALDIGPCEPDPACIVDLVPGVTACAESSGDSCDPLSPSCPAGEVCVPAGGGGGGSCFKTCSDDGDCLPPGGACGGGADCTVDNDCPTGTACDLGTFRCSTSCTTDPECVIPLSGTLLGVTAADATTPASCGGDLDFAKINSNDALECLAQIGTELGSACASICGNGIVGPGEQCDDGNATPGDGCDASCQLEP